MKFEIDERVSCLKGVSSVKINQFSLEVVA